MKILLSTFGQDDFDKIVQAMRELPYEKLVLLGNPDYIESKAFLKVKDLEEMAGHEVVAEAVPESGFMDMIDSVSDAIDRHAKDENGARNDLLMNISGGDKLLADAALFAAFRSGTEAYHCDLKLTKLPVLKGLTAKDRFTPSQVRFIEEIERPRMPFDALVESISPGNRQPVERVMRELKKAGLINTEVVNGKIAVTLSSSGSEVARAIKAV